MHYLMIVVTDTKPTCEEIDAQIKRWHVPLGDVTAPLWAITKYRPRGSVQVMDLDIPNIRRSEGIRAGIRWDRARQLAGSAMESHRTLEEFDDQDGIDPYVAYMLQDSIKLTRHEFEEPTDIDDLRGTRVEAVAMGRLKGMVHDAMIKNGEFIGKWDFEGTDTQWYLHFNALVDGLPGDQWITPIAYSDRLNDCSV